MSAARRFATYRDLCRRPHGVTAEIVDGERSTSPRQAGRHLDAASEIHPPVVPSTPAPRPSTGGG